MKPALIFPWEAKKSGQTDRQTNKIKLFGICGSRLGSPPVPGGKNPGVRARYVHFLSLFDETEIPDIFWMCVCLSVRFFGENCRGYKRRLQRLFFRLIFGSPKTDPPFWSLTGAWALQRGPTFFVTFPFFGQSYPHALMPSRTELRCIYPSQLSGFSNSEAPCSRGGKRVGCDLFL